MSGPLFRPRNLDPSKRIRIFVDQPDNNNNDLNNSNTNTTSRPTPSSSSSPNLLVSLSSTSTNSSSQQSLATTSQVPQRCAPQMPFVSGMEREEETVSS